MDRAERLDGLRGIEAFVAVTDHYILVCWRVVPCLHAHLLGQDRKSATDNKWRHPE